MKQYKLIKKLPFENSPEIGYISEQKYPSDVSHYWCGSWFNPKNYPEFWELVVKKSYEILSFINVNNKIYELQKDGRYFHYELKYNEYDYCLSELKIHSIKRLSDGEVFTIGDKIQLDNDNKEYGTITELYISHEQLRFYCDTLGGVLCHDLDKRNNFTIYISKKPLFTTEDGVGIFEGDIFWYVNNIKIKGYCLNKSNLNNPNDYHKVDDIKDFSTKEKAEEYILYNKPCLSYGEIQQYLKATDCENVLELVNTKINS
jgi:hypothetical protein